MSIFYTRITDFQIGNPGLVLNPPPRRNMVQRQNWFYRAGATAIFWVAGG